ncbi:hypothetical protein GCM10022206_14290 [Streptomyces chiangmaiensis]
MRFPGYCLAIADFIRRAKNDGIAADSGRGSADGSLRDHKDDNSAGDGGFLKPALDFIVEKGEVFVEPAKTEAYLASVAGA